MSYLSLQALQIVLTKDSCTHNMVLPVLLLVSPISPTPNSDHRDWALKPPALKPTNVLVAQCEVLERVGPEPMPITKLFV